MKKYDVAIIGGGVCGAAIARELSRYNLSTVLLEREVDVCFGVSKANSGIVHAGFHHGLDTLKARLEIKGNLMFERLQHEMRFPFKRVGIIVAAFSYEEMKTVEHLYDRGVSNGVPGVEICSSERILSLEPEINSDVVGGLYAPTGGVVEPYRFVFALIESAVANGLDLRTSFEVASSSFDSGCHEIVSSDGERISARFAVNAAGLYSDDVSRMFKGEDFQINPRKGEEYLLDRNSKARPNHVLFPVPSKVSKGMLVIPTVEGTTMVGPTAEMMRDKNDAATTAENLKTVFHQAKHMMPSISNRDIITAFTGSRPTLEDGDFYIEMSQKCENLVQVAGIQSPGLTASPAIAEYVKDILKSGGLELTEKVKYNADIPNFETIRNAKNIEAIDAIVAENPAYAKIICRCEKISEAEIVAAIHKGHTTLDGIKFYTRSGMGRCQGGFCSYKILKIIARETGIPVEEITKRGGDSRIVTGRLGECM